ncbi:MAG: sulfatase-like hydrolase/transferase [Parvibaculaceae bacterium]
MATAEPARTPNIVFIMADDLAAHDLSYSGRPDYQTEHIDQLASDGVLLTSAYSNSASCSPTRVALLSGRYQNRLDVGNYDPIVDGQRIGFPANENTIAKAFAAKGYSTGLVGKWHLGELPSFGPLKSGYGSFFGLHGSHVDYHSHDSSAPGTDLRKKDLFENETPVDLTGYLTDLISDKSIEFINRHHNDPFFLSVHYTAPHWPWQGPDHGSEPRQNDIHFDGGTPETYKSMVLSMDRGIGRIRQTLAELDLTEDTIIVFTSDNGGERYSYQWPLRGTKMDLWEGGIRVPGIVSWPAKITPGTSSDQVILSMDWWPTLMGLTSSAITTQNADLDGVDLSAQLLGGDRIERTVFWRTQWDHAVRSGDKKYLNREGREYLFDLSRDPMERANLRLKNSSETERIKSLYAEWSAQMQPIPLDARMPRSTYETLEALNPPQFPPQLNQSN